jgi:hypothetical protein
MERTQIFDLMGELKLYGMKAAFDEIMATAVKRQHEPQRIVGDLLSAEINEKQARSIKYQLTIAKLPLAKDIADFQFDGTPINQTLVNDLAGGGFIAQQRNIVLIGGTGTGKTHLAIAIARSCIRSGARGRFYNVVDLVNRLETETRNGRQGRLAEHLTRPRSGRLRRARRSATALGFRSSAHSHEGILDRANRVASLRMPPQLGQELPPPGQQFFHSYSILIKLHLPPSERRRGAHDSF